MFLWEVDERKNDQEFWNAPLSYVFMTVSNRIRFSIDRIK